MNKKMLVINLVAIAALLVAMLAVVSVAVADEDNGAPRVTTLSGAEEVGGGDPNGRGFASITLNHGQGTVCWEVSFENIAEPFAAHIHQAPAGVNGDVVVPLSPIKGGCSEVDPHLIKAIIQNPEGYYVNVHNADFPGGAIRGQLSNRGQSE